MKTQETAQERAEKFVHKKYGLCSDLSEQVQSDFIAGEESGERITLERLAAKARPENHPSCLEVNEAKNALAYLLLRKKKMGGTKKMDAKFDSMISGIEDVCTRIKTLESALVDMAKALEIATTYGLPPHDVSGREAWLSIYETKKLHQELLSEIGRDGK